MKDSAGVFLAVELAYCSPPHIKLLLASEWLQCSGITLHCTSVRSAWSSGGCRATPGGAISVKSINGGRNEHCRGLIRRRCGPHYYIWFRIRRQVIRVGKGIRWYAPGTLAVKSRRFGAFFYDTSTISFSHPRRLQHWQGVIRKSFRQKDGEFKLSSRLL